MSYITIDDVTLPNSDRVCFYFGFDNKQTNFAAKRSINGDVKSIKSTNYYDVFAWLGFSDIGMALYNSQKFKKKYRLGITPVLDNQLLVVIANNNPVFFFKPTQNEDWVWTDCIADLVAPYGEEIEQTIARVMGRNFIEMYHEYIRENEAQKKAHEAYIEMKKQEQPKTTEASEVSEAVPA